jgi:hypothetical protein
MIHYSDIGGIQVDLKLGTIAINTTMSLATYTILDTKLVVHPNLA